jgi:alpha-L-arabinofuranosidase
VRLIASLVLMVTAAVQFTDITAISKLGFKQENSPTSQKYLPETMGGGVEQSLGRSPIGVAVTEGHLSLRPHNANPIITEWLTGVYHARAMNTYERHGARVIAGTRWTVNAVVLPVPGGQSYLTPVGAVMRLFGRNRGTESVAVKSAPADLDVVASRKDNRIWLHVANTAFARSRPATFAVSARTVSRSIVHEISPEDVRTAASADEPDAFATRTRAVTGGSWRFSAVSVSVVELEVT